MHNVAKSLLRGAWLLKLDSELEIEPNCARLDIGIYKGLELDTSIFNMFELVGRFNTKFEIKR